MAIEYLRPGERFPGAVIHGDTVFLSGYVARDLSGDLYHQTSDILQQIEETLAGCGSDKTKILWIATYLRNVEEFEEHHRAWTDWWDPKHKPCRTVVGAKLVSPDCRVEITAIAARGAAP
jgi:enamine deaminase RidA (YjgF/YER057c/UK114 family)